MQAATAEVQISKETQYVSSHCLHIIWPQDTGTEPKEAFTGHPPLFEGAGMPESLPHGLVDLSNSLDCSFLLTGRNIMHKARLMRRGHQSTAQYLLPPEQPDAKTADAGAGQARTRCDAAVPGHLVPQGSHSQDKHDPCGKAHQTCPWLAAVLCQ